jgi:hypothetical protein
MQTNHQDLIVVKVEYFNKTLIDAHLGQGPGRGATIEYPPCYRL